MILRRVEGFNITCLNETISNLTGAACVGDLNEKERCPCSNDQKVEDNKPEDEQTVDETKSGDYQSVEDSKLEEALKVEANKEDQKRDTMEDRLVDVIYKALKSLL